MSAFPILARSSRMQLTVASTHLSLGRRTEAHFSSFAMAAAAPAAAEQGGYYSITILNKSGSRQSYSLYNEAPTVKPSVNGLTSRAILVVQGVVSGSGSALLTIPQDNYYALAGSGFQDGTVQNFNLDRRPVKLGSTSSSNKKPGTTCVLSVTSDGPPSFTLWEGQANDTGEPGSFCVQTQGGFSYEEAKNKRFIVAMGVSTSATLRVGAYASFVPSPNTPYQIKPSKSFYVVARDAGINQPKPQDVNFADCCKVDFAVRPWEVLLVHEDDNVLRFSDEGEATFN